MNLIDKVIVVTGGAGDIGRATAGLLLAKGAKVALVDRDPDLLAVAAEEHPGVDTYITDISDETQVSEVMQRVASDLGSLDGLVNNAGVLRDGLLIKHKDGELRKAPLSDFQTVVDVNLTGVFLCAREAAEQMIRCNSSGVIINISSVSRAGNYGQSNYSATKAGVVAMTTTWCKELAEYGIRSAAIAPGFIETAMTASMPDKALQKVNTLIPAARMGKPEEIASGVVFICENDYFNGRVLEIDGGMRL